MQRCVAVHLEKLYNITTLEKTVFCAPLRSEKEGRKERKNTGL